MNGITKKEDGLLLEACFGWCSGWSSSWGSGWEGIEVVKKDCRRSVEEPRCLVVREE